MTHKIIVSENEFISSVSSRRLSEILTGLLPGSLRNY